MNWLPISSNKIEQKSITKVRDLIDRIKLFKSCFNEGEKGISWDGTIEMYNGNPDKKENYDYSIDVQIKGRTSNNKKLNDKTRFSVERVDLENYLKKDGTILIVCLFKRDSELFKIYYISLLPYNIRMILKSNDSLKIKLDLKEIKDANDFEKICRNFKIDREIQKKIPDNIFDQKQLKNETGSISKFFVWDNDFNNFNPKDLIGEWKYFYTSDKNGNTIDVKYGMLSSLLESIEGVASDKDKTIIYDDIKIVTDFNGNKVIWGNAFTFDLNEKKFNYSISGTLLERVKQLEFIKKVLLDKVVCINDFEIGIKECEKNIEKIEKLLNRYLNIYNFFEVHCLDLNIDFDDWKDEDLNKLEFWINAIEKEIPIGLKSEISLMGSVKIKDIRLSIFANIREDKKFDIYSLWNNHKKRKYFFKYQNDMKTENIYLVLNDEAYISDDINILEMKESFKNKKITDDEYFLMNMQLLEVLKAYDKNKNKKLLEYANFLANILLEKDANSEVFYINYAQILKRENKLKTEHIKKLIEIKNNSSDVQIKLCCNLLIDNKNEVDFWVEKLNSSTLEEFKKFPIAIYL